MPSAAIETEERLLEELSVLNDRWQWKTFLKNDDKNSLGRQILITPYNRLYTTTMLSTTFWYSPSICTYLGISSSKTQHSSKWLQTRIGLSYILPSLTRKFIYPLTVSTKSNKHPASLLISLRLHFASPRPTSSAPFASRNEHFVQWPSKWQKTGLGGEIRLRTLISCWRTWSVTTHQHHPFSAIQI